MKFPYMVHIVPVPTQSLAMNNTLSIGSAYNYTNTQFFKTYDEAVSFAIGESKSGTKTCYVAKVTDSFTPSANIERVKYDG